MATEEPDAHGINARKSLPPNSVPACSEEPPATPPQLGTREYEEDLNTTLIFAGLFSAVTSSFIIDCRSRLPLDPNEQSAAFLRAILLVVDQSAIPVVPSPQLHPSTELDTVGGLMSASLGVSLLAAFIAMSIKQHSHFFPSHERGGGRSRKRNGERLLLLAESLPVMLQVSLLLFACGLYRYTVPIHSFLPALKALFYPGIIIASAYALFRNLESAVPRRTPQVTPEDTFPSPLSAENSVFRFSGAPSIARRLWDNATVSTASVSLRFFQIVLLMVRLVRYLSQWVRPRTERLPSLPPPDDPSILNSPSILQMLDSMDQALREDSLCTNDRKKVSAVLGEVCHTHGVLPPSCKITGSLGWTGDQPVRIGGFADVWRGTLRGSPVAIKVVRAHLWTDRVGLEKRFCRETVLWKQFRHPNLLPFVGAKKTSQTLIVVSEWMENGTVLEFINAFPETNRLKLLADTARGLNHLHEWPIVHGNVKMSNILVDKNHTARIAGLSSAFLPHSLTIMSMSASAGAGTYEWMAPELFSENSHPSRESDIYAFGMVIYEIFARQRPFCHVSLGAMPMLIVAGERPPRPPNQDTLGLSEDVWMLTRQCWDPDPNNRPCIADVLAHFEAASRDWVSPTPKAISNLSLDPPNGQIFDNWAGGYYIR